jgi:hypothetical protein
MIKHIRFVIISFLFTATALGVKAQSTATTSSPYSRYGLGDISPMLLPQNVGMGGIGVATNSINGFFSVNPLNPASYSSMKLTVIDVGIYGKFNTLEKTGQTSQKNSNFRLSHIAFGIPVSKRSAFSFGLMPYSELGYSYRQSDKLGTDTANYIYSGDGGLSKFYLGYGIGIGKHLSIGANVSYIFGNLKETQSTEIPTLPLVLNSRIEESNSITGLNYDYGVQYGIDFSAKRHLTFGYSGSASTKLNSVNSYIVSSYTRNASTGDEGVATDSLINRQQPSAKVLLPMINRFGISFQNDGKFLIGADYTMSNWSKLTVAGVNKGLRDSKTFNVGGQFTPNINSLSSYWSAVDYRAGFIYDQTYLNVNSGGVNNNIKRYAATLGLGLPLRGSSTSFYKINMAAEIGRRGTLTNGLVKENYVNVHLSFTLNDKWFQKYRFD